MRQGTSGTPRIAITAADPSRSSNPDLARRKNQLYADAVARPGGEAVLLDASTDAADREAALESMDGLILSGGGDIDPARYGQPNRASTEIQPERDELEAAAWEVAQARGLPVLGICRGFQAINVLSGGSLLQDVEGHRGAGWGEGAAATHNLRLAPGTRLSRLLFPTNPRGGVLTVNSYHHQAVRPADLAAGLVASGWSPSPGGEIVEALETADGRFVIGVQSHPERVESTPKAFERLFSVFVDAARGPLRR
jgi:gamma-glutamyl-gamma-aminobutyrate hydrolase PuuD